MRTLIIGGGLSGLALAEALESQGRDYILLEARLRLGGRILTQHQQDGYFDMGPAWFWPGQPRIDTMIDRLGLQKFDQYCDGALVFEDERGQVHRGRGFSSMEGSWRLVGGFGALITALAERIPDHRKLFNANVTEITKSDDMCIATLSNGQKVSGDQVVLSLPPRIAALINFTPALPNQTMQMMQAIPTWMAGQAKAMAIYDRPFWREEGLSGDAMSHKGPAAEIHDASPKTGGPYALFGFVGVSPDGRADDRKLRQELRAQLARLFGPQAADPRQLYIKDWAFDPYTATQADKTPMYAHPTYGLPRAMTELWNGALHFSGTEVAANFGGYIEGALEAAENVLDTLGI
ncbi:hypothetical protein GCM10007939_14410 [Amylibacter marinus]|uniref:Amine oxidase domain-containing protein n=1 Tax=Amylibacter marinus TaxID=1475483 RepID=A0ABQ5VVP0_9RHOB|nr:NAD(P)/FAD-dependent oxidoreductase [Amylibacter marinus]GLQ35158.1 hypothetical protein GCM10007939_14410 [Amylibacter marinus]